jgi:hypothetical protein
MPLQATSGAASQDGFGGNGVAVVPQYIEDVFSTYLYTGNSANQTIVNGIDLASKGGLVWVKNRQDTTYHNLFDTNRGIYKRLYTPVTDAQVTNTSYLTAFNSNGFDTGTGLSDTFNYVSWTWRKQAKYFDVQTWTGTGSNTTIAHSLGSVPGCIIVKRLDTVGAWQVYHRSLANTDYLVLNTTAASATGATRWNSTTPTSTVFSLGTDATVNASGGTYIAYIFAHDAGGFGLTGTDNVISCGAFTTDGSGNASVNLGYEPQFWLYKPNLAARYWTIYDVMRGWSQTEIRNLNPNVSDAEGGGAATAFYPTATGFDCVGSNLDASTEHIYIAIRRGPMKVPTNATNVFNTVLRTGTGSAATVTGVGFTPDSLLFRPRDIGVPSIVDRLRGPSARLNTDRTDTEAVSNGTTQDVISFNTDGMTVGTEWNTQVNRSGSPIANWFFKRAPSFFDEVCYTGTGSAATISHNLGVVPDLIIFKNRGSASSWPVNVRSINTNNWVLSLDEDTARQNSALFSSAPTSTTMTFTGAQVNATSNLYVAYLFATCAGVSKVGSYTGNGSSQTIDCGFSAGARFVLIKRNNDVGDWYVWDTARGIVSGNDPHLSLNTTAAEVTTDDTIDTNSTGFVVNQVAATNVNVSSGTYIFLAIA